MYSNLIVAHVLFLVSILIHKACHITLKYKCLFKKSDHIRPMYLMAIFSPQMLMFWVHCCYLREEVQCFHSWNQNAEQNSSSLKNSGRYLTLQWLLEHASLLVLFRLFCPTSFIFEEFTNIMIDHSFCSVWTGQQKWQQEAIPLSWISPKHSLSMRYFVISYFLNLGYLESES